MAPEDKLLCDACSSHLQLLDPAMRCTRCFGPMLPCPRCKKSPPDLSGLACCFDYYGPMKRILHAFKYGDEPHLASPLASFLFLQFTQAGWPQPDLITYVPQFFLRTKIRGYNQSKQLADELSRLLGVPCASLLHKHAGLFPQAILSKKARRDASLKAISLSTQTAIEDKIILLIDDVYTTGRTIQICTDALAVGYPRAVYALTLCYTDIANGDN